MPFLDAIEPGTFEYVPKRRYGKRDTDFVGKVVRDGKQTFFIELCGGALGELSESFPNLKTHFVWPVAYVKTGAMPYYRKRLQDIAKSCSGRGLLVMRAVDYRYLDEEFGQLFVDAFSAGLDVALVDAPRLFRKQSKREMMQQAGYRVQVGDRSNG